MTPSDLARRIADYRPAKERPPATEQAIADAIKAERLETAIYGRGPDGRPRTFEQAFKEVFGRNL